MRYNANQLAPVRPLLQVAGAHLLQQASYPYGTRRQSAGSMLHLGISSARNPLALRESLHSRLRSGIRSLVAVSATSKCRGLIPRLLFYLGAYIGARPEHIRRRERRSGWKGPVLPFDPRGPRPVGGHCRQGLPIRAVPRQLRPPKHTVPF